MCLDGTCCFSKSTLISTTVMITYTAVQFIYVPTPYTEAMQYTCWRALTLSNCTYQRNKLKYNFGKTYRTYVHCRYMWISYWVLYNMWCSGLSYYMGIWFLGLSDSWSPPSSCHTLWYSGYIIKDTERTKRQEKLASPTRNITFSVIILKNQILRKGLRL